MAYYLRLTDVSCETKFNVSCTPTLKFLLLVFDCPDGVAKFVLRLQFATYWNDPLVLRSFIHNIRELKRLQQWRQEEQQKSNRFWLAKR